MPASTRKPAAKSSAKPARKGTVRTSAGGASPVKTRTLSASEKKAGIAKKLSKPKPAAKTTRAKKVAADRTAGKRVKNPAATTGGGALSAERVREIAAVGKLRAKGMKWEDIAAETGASLSALARMRLVGKREGIAGFTR